MLMWVISAVGLAVILGHLYPIFYGFKGGKGVATALGVMLAISLWLALAAGNYLGAGICRIALFFTGLNHCCGVGSGLRLFSATGSL